MGFFCGFFFLDVMHTGGGGEKNVCLQHLYLPDLQVLSAFKMLVLYYREEQKSNLRFLNCGVVICPIILLFFCVCVSIKLLCLKLIEPLRIWILNQKIVKFETTRPRTCLSFEDAGGRCMDVKCGECSQMHFYFSLIFLIGVERCGSP